MKRLHFQPLSLTAIAATALLATACQDEEFGYSADEIKYEKNFIQTYGDIPAGKCWDLSSSAGWGKLSDSETRGTSGTTSNLIEDNGSNTATAHYVRKDWWQVPQNTLDWMRAYLTEGKDNRYLGSSFVLKMPTNSDFAIVPIYQGHSAIMSELEIKINGYEMEKIWERCQDIQCWVKDGVEIKNSNGDVFNVTEGKKEQDGDGHWYQLGYYNGYSSLEKEAQHWDKSKTTMHPSYTDNDCDEKLRAKPIYFRSSKIGSVNGGYMYLSLHNTNTFYNSDGSRWSDDGSWTTKGNRLTSINSKGHMLALQVPYESRPTNLPNFGENSLTPSKVMMIACEDAEGASTDNDVNDVVFLIIGYPELPEVIPTKHVIKKRYMCEDLGATDDFDFNDIVIDVTQTEEWEIQPVDKTDEYNGEDAEIGVEINMVAKPGTKKQVARIAHVCGTLPIQVMVGDLYFPKITDPTNDFQTRTELAADGYKIVNGDKVIVPDQTTRAIVDIAQTDGWNPNEVKVVTGWNPSENNIRIFVDWKSGRKPDNQTHESKEYIGSDGKSYTASSFADFSNGEVVTVEFPHDGDVPYIIATDQDVPWMAERQDIPEEWVQSGNTSIRTGAAPDQHGNINYLDYGNNQVDGEAVVWQGLLHRYGNETGLTLAAGSAEIKGIDEAANSKGFKGIVIYTTTPGTFGIKVNNTAKDGWVSPTGDDANFYNVDTQADKTEDNLYRTVVMLTDEQISSIINNGLVITLGTASMELRQISMLRPIEFNGINANGQRDSNLGWHKTRYYVKAPAETIEGGRISATDRGSYTYASNGNINGEATIPFSRAAYRIGTTSTFKATPLVGYRFKNWQNNAGTPTATDANNMTAENYQVSSDKLNNANISIIKTEAEVAANNNKTYEITLPTPVFETCVNPELKFKYGSGTTKALTVKKGESRSFYINSKSNNSICFDYVDEAKISVSQGTFGAKDDNNIYECAITVNGETVGSTTFIFNQTEGQVDGQYYSVSETMTIDVEVVEMPTAEVPLTADQFHSWSGESNAYITSNSGYFDNAAYYGCNGAWPLDYANLSETTSVLVLKVSAGEPSFVFNKKYVEASRWNTDAFEVKKGNNDKYLSIYDFGNNEKYYIVDIAALKSDRGYVHLNSIKSSVENGTLSVESMKVDSYSCSAETVWSQDQTRISSATATLGMSDIYEWSGWTADATIVGNGSDSNKIWQTTEFTESGKPICGHKDAYGSYYIDLTKAKTLLVKTTNDTEGLTFWINRGGSDGWAASQNIDAKTPSTTAAQEQTDNLCHVIYDGNDRLYVVDLAGYRTKYGVSYVHLNGINLNGAKATIKEVKVDTKESDAVTKWKAQEALLAKISTAKLDVTLAMYHEWENGSIKTLAPTASYGIGTNSEKPYGDCDQVRGTHYADLSSADVLVAVIKDGDYGRFIFNNKEDNAITIHSNDESDYAVKKDNGDGTFTYIIDLAKIRQDKGHSHLNTIKANAGASDSNFIYSLKVDKYTSPEKSYYKNLQFETTISIDNSAQEGKVSIYNTSHGSTSGAYGCSSVEQNCYANLSSYSVLKIAIQNSTSTRGPRALFNVVEENGSKTFLEIKSDVNSSYMTVDNTTWTGWSVYFINLGAIKQLYNGVCKLNCIKEDYSVGTGDIKISDMQLKQ